MTSAKTIIFALLGVAALAAMQSCGSGKAPEFKTEVDVTPPEDSIGERLFLDTRFAE